MAHLMTPDPILLMACDPTWPHGLADLVRAPFRAVAALEVLWRAHRRRLIVEEETRLHREAVAHFQRVSRGY